MVERLILIRLERSDEAGRALARADLQGVLRAHPGSARCGLPADAEAGKSWDLAVLVERTGDAPDQALVERIRAALGDRVEVLKTWVFSW